jgi:predicted nucleic acid-binding protein
MSFWLLYEEVLQFKTTEEIATNVTNFLSVYSSIIHKEPFIDWHLISKDPDDNKYIDCSIAANAYCIVSKDAHFRPFKNNKFPPLLVLTLDEFESRFKQ